MILPAGLFTLPRFAMLVLACATGSHLHATTWSKTYLAATSPIFDANGTPVLDEFGDLVPSIPLNFAPSVRINDDGFHYVWLEMSAMAEPPEIDTTTGLPILGQYHRLGVATNSGAWSVEAVTDLAENTDQPHFADRLDGVLSLAYWRENLLYVDTLEQAANTRLTLPIQKMSGAVAIDDNGGVHVAVIRANYELWLYYYDQTSLTSIKVSDGPVCSVSIAAGVGDTSHLVYSTFSEDVNFNQQLDDGEDLNNNTLLDETSAQLIYQRMDAGSLDFSDVIISDTLIKICHLDLYNANSSGLCLAYADPVRNLVCIASKASSDAAPWQFQIVSSQVSNSASVALAQNDASSTSGIDYAVSYISGDGSQLFVSESSAGVWTESLVAENTSGDYFRATDLGFGADGQPVVLASEKAASMFLTGYSKSALPSVFVTEVAAIEIRSAYVLEWAAPAENVLSQTLQSTTDLSDPNSWLDVNTSSSFFDDERDSYKMFVEPTGNSQFYRVLSVTE
ncbi:hypothetical protein QEH52_12095 [Coraliomargarita sp. SDUM461003]|uniref:Uncharacterized protein n=1 Tax=Thalassobacterium maritimum TaxID=3041265 RepID=A0ABU1AVT0_9BACT|nr:hypothetical protein [Coraliomargarita sp. SDUM461003]MDQ8208255.1 hypothetical protein [Coraliomargarita sp. SDUM461003]